MEPHKMKNGKRRIAVVTGTRAEYGLLRSIMHQIIKSKDLELSLIVTGCHLSRKFGYTVKDIVNDGFKIAAKIPIYSNFEKSGTKDIEIPISLGRGLTGMAKVLNKIKPDFLVLLGDRGEPLIATIAATYLNIPIAHIHGGDQAGGADLDDNIRHAITKLSHIHFVATKKSALRVMNLGEEKWRIHITGAPGLDSIFHEKLPQPVELSSLFNLDLKKPIIILLQHAVSSQAGESKKQMEETMKAITELKLQTVIIYPNIDPGNLDIIGVINKYKNLPFIRTSKSLPYNIFLGLMKTASVIVGNSSSAIIEAPSLRLATVDIGVRQKGRERADNILNVGHNKNEIKSAIIKAIGDDAFKRVVRLGKSLYGNGKAGQKIIELLLKIKIDKKLLNKQFVIYHNNFS